MDKIFARPPSTVAPFMHTANVLPPWYRKDVMIDTINIICNCSCIHVANLNVEICVVTPLVHASWNTAHECCNRSRNLPCRRPNSILTTTERINVVNKTAHSAPFYTSSLSQQSITPQPELEPQQNPHIRTLSLHAGFSFSLTKSKSAIQPIRFIAAAARSRRRSYWSRCDR
jgi:hypothetical protein